MEENKYELIYPLSAYPGSIGVVAKKRYKQEIIKLQNDSTKKKYRLNAFISDHIPLIGNVEDVLKSPSHNLIFINDCPCSINLHHGRRKIVYYDLVSNEQKKLEYIQVGVETILPFDAFRLARGAINQLLDALVSMVADFTGTPLVIKNLDLLSLDGNYILAHEILLPFNGAYSLRSFGIHQIQTFLPYEGLLREAKYQ